MKRAGLILGVALSLALLAAAKEKKPEQAATLNFTVLKAANGKPVRNASVILHPVNKDGKQERGGLQLKTDADGKASLDGIPYGKLRVQVIAPGFQTYGEDYDINQQEHDLVIKLNRPKEQLSIYK